MESIWSRTTQLPAFPQLQEDLQTDIAVIGGGMAGILIANDLAQKGREVVVLEAASIASGQTKNTTAKITVSHNLIYDKLITSWGIEKARQYAHANQEAMYRYENLILKNEIDCHYKKLASYLYSVKEKDALEKEVDAARRLGLDAVFTDETMLPFEIMGAIKYQQQAQFHPLEFIKGLISSLTIYEHTKVIKVEGQTIKTERAKVEARHIVFATHFPFINFPGYYFMRMHQSRSYVLALKHAVQLDGMYLGIDEENSLSLRNYEDYLLFGGEGHRTGENTVGGKYEELKKTALSFWQGCSLETAWSAQDCMTADGVPYIGRYSSSRPNWYVTTGFGKWGMTLSMVSSMIISDMICGIENPYQEVFSPQRFPEWEAMKNMAMEGMASTKGLVKENFTIPAEKLEELPKEHGGLVEYDGKKAGVYKDAEGEVFVVSTRCPHLGCQLEWNPDEKSWDCPCHGSRFDYKGNLIDNPAQEGIGEE